MKRFIYDIVIKGTALFVITYIATYITNLNEPFLYWPIFVTFMYVLIYMFIGIDRIL